MLHFKRSFVTHAVSADVWLTATIASTLFWRRDELIAMVHQNRLGASLGDMEAESFRDGRRVFLRESPTFEISPSDEHCIWNLLRIRTTMRVLSRLII
jgi:hypothetical protein